MTLTALVNPMTKFRERLRPRRRYCSHGVLIGSVDSGHFLDAGYCSDTATWRDYDPYDSGERKYRSKRIGYFDDQRKIREGGGLYGWSEKLRKSKQAKYNGGKRYL